MLTFIVEQKQVDKDYTLKELLDYSRKYNWRIIIREFAMFESGVLTYLS